MSQNQQATTGAATDSLAAEMPSVPGAQTAKNIIENAIHPHQDQAASAAPAAAGTTAAQATQTLAQGASSGLGGAGVSASAGPQPASAGMGAATATVAEPFVDQVIDLPIMGETLTFAKRAVVTEEVLLQKRPFTEEESVSDVVRRERVTVEGADVVQGADDQIGARLDDRYAQDEQQGEQGGSGVQDTLQQGAQNVQQGATDAKHGLDNLIDSAVDRIFGGHKQQ